MMGDAGDMEHDVAPDNIRKVLSHRLIKRKLRKLINSVHAAMAFAHKGPVFGSGNGSSNNDNSPSAQEAKGAEDRLVEAEAKGTVSAAVANDSDAKSSGSGVAESK